MNEAQEAQEPALVPRMDEQTRLRYAAQLKPARVKAGLTQAEAAEVAGVARNTYAAMESGATIPQAEKLWRAMLAVGIQPSTSDEPTWLQEWWQIIAPLARRVPPEKRAQVMGEIVQALYGAVVD